jgi:hypothetical protein
MISLDRLDAFDGDELTVIIEMPKGSPNKYTYGPRFGAFALDGVRPLAPSSITTSASCRQRLVTTATPSKY